MKLFSNIVLDICHVFTSEHLFPVLLADIRLLQALVKETLHAAC